VLVLIYANVASWATSPEIFNDYNALASLFLATLIDALVGAALGALGGYLGKRVFTK
jgi:NhaP-type Na+/H+ or K+/H+ antiporter